MLNRRLSAVALALVTMLYGATQVHAQLEPTTEYGITITPQMIFDAIQESQDFWPGVRKHIVSAEFQVAEAPLRNDAVKFLKNVDSRLSELLFGSDQQQAKELLEFLGARLRKFEMYRKLRTILNDDALLAQCKDRWEMEVRTIYRLAEAEQPAATKKLLEQIKADMQAARVSGEKLEKAVEQWNLLSQNMGKMNQSRVGQVMSKFEDELRAGDPRLRELLTAILRASDWATIARADSKPLRTAHFVIAWESCLRYERQQANQATESSPLK